MDKEEYWRSINKKDEELVEKYPEMNGSYEVKNEDGEWVVGYKLERYIKYPIGFLEAGIIRELSSSAVKVFNILISLCNKYRNTSVMDKTLIKLSGIGQETITKVLRELRYYHLISSHLLPGGGLKKRRRKITLNRWDTARALLLKENKMKLGLDDRIDFLKPNPYKKTKPIIPKK